MWLNSVAVYVASVATAVLGICLITGFVAANADAKLVVGSALLVTSGVMFTAAVKLHSEERDRAYRFLTENQSSPELLSALYFLARFRAMNGEFTLARATEIYTKQQRPDYQTVVKKISVACNFFEEMAIGVKSKQINEYIVREFYIGMLFRVGAFLKPILPVIRNTPVIPGHPFGGVSKPEVYVNLFWLYDRWAPLYQNSYLGEEAGFWSSYSWTGRGNIALE